MRRLSVSHIILLVATTIFPGAAESLRSEGPCSEVDSWSVGYNFDRKVKVSTHSNDEADVHQAVLENVLHQLREKVGVDFIKNLHFSHVEGVDFDRESELSFGDLKRLDAYVFTFEVRAGEGGVYKYTFAIRTDQYGRFLSDVEIPDVAISPKKGIVRDCLEAVNVARTTKTLSETKQIFVRLRFDKAENVFIWDVYAYREGVGRGLHSDHVWLNANNLTVIKKYDQREPF